MHVSGVFGAVLGAERLELHQVYVLKSRQFIQNPLGSFVQIFVHIDQTAGQLHIMEDFTLFFSGTFNQQDFQLLSVKTNHHTVYRNMIVCQWRILFHVLHNIFV